MAEETITRTRRVRLGYLQTIKAGANELDMLVAAGVSSTQQPRDLVITDQEDTYIPGTGGVQPGSAVEVEVHAIGDTGWIKDDTSEIVVYDRARIAVGIRDIELAAVKYAANGMFITKPYRTINPIKAVSIVANEFIPPGLPEGQYIMYSISFDGKAWSELLPKNTPLVLDRPKRLTVNFRDSDDKDSEQVSVEGQPTVVYLKVEIVRPDDSAFAGTTPILRHYDLHVEVKK